MYYLFLVPGSREIPNEKQFFYNHRSSIYAIFFESFIQLDAAKHRGSAKGFGSISDYIGADGINSSQREDLELALFTFERLLLLLPEVLEDKWQLNSIVFCFRKMLHYSNVIRIRHDGVRLFLIYYQILGERIVREHPQLEVLYASIIPGVVTDLAANLSPRNPAVLSGPITVQHLADSPDLSAGSPVFGARTDSGPVQPFPNEPFIPMMLDHASPTSAHLVQAATPVAASVATTSPALVYTPQYEYKPEIQRYFLELLLDYSISQCDRIQWTDYRDRKCHRAFEFLMASFSRIYLPYIFPKMAVLLNPDRPQGGVKQWPVYTVHPTISVYGNAPLPTLPGLRRYADHLKSHFVYSPTNGTPMLSVQVQLQTIVIQWFTKYLMDPEKGDQGATLVSGWPSGQGTATTLTQESVSNGSRYSTVSQISASSHHGKCATWKLSEHFR